MTGQRLVIAHPRRSARPPGRGRVAPARRRDHRIALSTVYRTVKLLENEGIIERLDFRGGRSATSRRPASTTTTSSTSRRAT